LIFENIGEVINFTIVYKTTSEVPKSPLGDLGVKNVGKHIRLTDLPQT